ncbi:hypothetical protein QJS10_CPA01g01283 [Acorus calamus]|uniref:UVR domain-containing protein n=1 Tax=Acorus calamus TaxID=4465 RepID=A0AAV9FJJ5_ACOCL|nr:hypothetical protein QJS10_CPA01g01283 [Acorus calamus]
MESPSARVGPGLGIRTGNVDSDRWRPRRCKAVSFVVASSSSSSSSEREEPSERSSSFLSRIQTYALKQQLAVAAKFEDYREAARIRDSLKSFEDEEPVLRLRRLIKQAIKEERFENKLNWMLIGSSYWPLPIAIPCWMVVDSYQDAACHRDELRLVAPQSLLKCSSDATTLEGDFEMKHNDRVGSPTFNVAIAPLCLAILGDDDDIM